MNLLASCVSAAADRLLPELEAIYKDLHQNPELSLQEHRTARIAADYVEKHGYEVTRNVGGTGVVALLRNGSGPVVMLRADMDALPIVEETGLPYASTVTAQDDDGRTTGVSHMCGHDLHVSWLMGAGRLLAENQDLWQGTVMLVFQPGEEVGRGADDMMDDGMPERFPKPDIILGQHVMPSRAGTVGYKAGPILASGDSLKVTLFGRGSHGSMPQSSIDPVVMAASTALRLQTIVSREVAPSESAVVTIGALHAGVKENVISDQAVLKLNVRTGKEDIRSHVLSAIRRICCAECQASNAPREPEFEVLNAFPLTENDQQATARIAQAFKAHFADRAHEEPMNFASEDFSIFGRRWGVPYVFWFIGGTEAATYDQAEKEGKLNEIPVNHSSRFAPALHPTLQTGLEAMLAAVSPWLARG